MIFIKSLGESAPCPWCGHEMMARTFDGVHVTGYCSNLICTYTYQFQQTLPFICKELVAEWNREAAEERIRIRKK